MLDKDNQRRRQSPAPHGRMPNWLLAVVAGTFTAVAVLANTLS
jgi:hypothetical protein